jgi:hypothetical protein
LAKSVVHQSNIIEKINRLSLKIVGLKYLYNQIPKTTKKMDRQLHVIKNGYLFAELVFNYQSQTTGVVNITFYRPIAIGEGLYPVVPLVTFQTAVAHPALNTIGGIETFDRAFVKALPAPPQGDEPFDYSFDDRMQYVYDAVHYRYVLGNGGLSGIADIYANFTENTKELKFTSGIQISFDASTASNSMECNVDLCKRFCETYFDKSPTELTRLGWHYM